MNDMSYSLNKSRLFIGIILMIGFAPFFFLFFRSAPSADDYEMALKSKKEGYFKEQVIQWHQWNGRYTATAFQSAPVLMNIAAYQLVGVIMLFTFLHAGYLFIRTTFKIKNRAVPLLFSLTFLFFYILVSLETTNFYWLSAQATYVLPIILFLYFLSLLHLRKCALICYSVGALMVFLLVGTSEVAMLFFDFFLLFLFLIYFFQKKQFSWKIFFYGLIAFFSSLLLVLAPGNRIRAGKFSGGKDVTDALVQAFFSTKEFVYKWIFVDSYFWLFLVSVFLFTLVYSQKNKNITYKIHPVISFFLVNILIFIAFFVPNYSFGSNGPERAQAFIQFIAFFSYALFMVSCAAYFSRSTFSKDYADTKNSMIFVGKFLYMAFLILTILKSDNLTTAYEDVFSKKATIFYNENREFIKEIEKGKNDKPELSSFSAVPKTNAFRGNENFVWICRYYEKDCLHDSRYLKISDKKIIEEHMEEFKDMPQDNFVVYSEKDRALIYSSRSDKQEDVSLKLFADKALLRGEDKKKGYFTRDFVWRKKGKQISENYYHVEHLPAGYVFKKAETGLKEGDGNKNWEQVIVLVE